MLFVLHLSYTPVRKALIKLSKVGLVEIQPQRGSCIARIIYELIGESRFVHLILESAVLKPAYESISQEYMDRLKEYLRVRITSWVLCEIKKIPPREIRMKYIDISWGYPYFLPPFYCTQVL